MTTTQSDAGITIQKTDNAELLRQGFEAFGRGDLEFIKSRLTDDCEWTNAGASPAAGTYRGWDAIQAMLVKLFEITDGTYRTEIVSLLSSETQAAAIYDATATVNGVTETHRWFMVQDVDAQGRGHNVHCVAFDQAAADSIFAAG